MINILKKNIHLLIVALYGYILFYKIKKKDYTSMLLLTLFTAVLIIQLRKESMIEGQQNTMESGIKQSQYVETSGEGTTAGGTTAGGTTAGETTTGETTAGETTTGGDAGGNKQKKADLLPLQRKVTINENIKAPGDEGIETTTMDMKLNDESKDIKIFDDSIRIGAYDGLCLSSIQKASRNEIVTNEELNTYFGHHLPRRANRTIDDVLTGPSIDGAEGSPTKLSVFANNKTSLNCCGDSPFSTTTGCVCLTEKQKKYIQNRGFNKQYGEV